MEFTCVVVDGGNKVQLDVSDLEFENKEVLKPYLNFNCSTFKNIKDYQTNKAGFDSIFKIPNWAISKLSTEGKIELAKFFGSACYTIKESMHEKLASVPAMQAPMMFIQYVEELGRQYYEMCDRIHIYDLFTEYANTITLQDTSTFGDRPQDTPELTFKEPEIRQTMVLAMFCKLATPIFGELINNLPAGDFDHTRSRLPRQRESRCSWFLSAIQAHYFRELIGRLEFYISHIVRGLCDKNNDGNVAPVFAGHTPNTRVATIMSSLMVRNFVLCNLEQPESNIIRYTDTMVRTLVQTQDTNAKKAQVKLRNAPGTMMSGDDGGKMAQIEIDSLVSDGTMDTQLIIEASIDSIIDDYRLRYEITKDEFDKCLNYFLDGHPVYQTPLNRYVATVVFGRDIGGGRGIDLIDSLAYTKLAVMLQLIALSMNMYPLMVALTATKTNNVRITLGKNEDLFKRMAPTRPNYIDCRSRFATGDSGDIYLDVTKSVRERAWDMQMEELINDLATVNYTANVPEYILDLVPAGKDEPIGSFIHNGEEIIPTVEITEDACKLVTVFDSETF